MSRMDKAKNSWQRLPNKIRQPIVFVVGMIFVIASGLTGWLPGPGGIPLFLIGVAILSSEFEWAQRFRDWSLAALKRYGVTPTPLFGRSSSYIVIVTGQFQSIHALQQNTLSISN